MTTRGLPHSEISGSSLVGSSPKLIAACYVLHRLSCQGIHLCALMYLLRRFVLEHNLKLQSMLCAWTRSHVWHMKVLLYAVFKVRVRDSLTRRRSHSYEKRIAQS
jgi:hypothetical protein